MNLRRHILDTTHDPLLSFSSKSMKLILDVSPALADEIIKLNQIHNRRILDFTKAEGYMDRMRYDISDKIMTLVTHEVLEQSRMLTLQKDD